MATTARAEEILEPGDWRHANGATLTVGAGGALVLDSSDTARLVLFKRACERTQAALGNCEKRAVAPPKRETPWHVYGSIVVAVFAAGVAVGVTSK